MNPEVSVYEPPIIEKIKGRFPDLTGNEIFAYDNVIYNPSRGALPPWLIEHEKVHFKQQGNDPDGWWDRYLVDDEFRFAMELQAHRVEYRVFCKHHKDRNHRAMYLLALSRRLASDMYGNITTVRHARKMIKRKE